MKQQIVNYLNRQKVPFAIKNGSELVPVKITKTGKFFRANGKIISKSMLNALNSYGWTC